MKLHNFSLDRWCCRLFIHLPTHPPITGGRLFGFKWYLGCWGIEWTKQISIWPHRVSSLEGTNSRQAENHGRMQRAGGEKCWVLWKHTKGTNPHLRSCQDFLQEVVSAKIWRIKGASWMKERRWVDVERVLGREPEWKGGNTSARLATGRRLVTEYTLLCRSDGKRKNSKWEWHPGGSKVMGGEVGEMGWRRRGSEKRPRTVIMLWEVLLKLPCAHELSRDLTWRQIWLHYF